MMRDLISEPLSLEEASQASNVAELLDENDLRQIGQDLKRLVELDDDSRADWKKGMERGLNLFLQVRDDKDYPFTGASNVIYPSLLKAVTQFAARCYPALVPGPTIVRCKVMGDDTAEYYVPPGVTPQIAEDGKTPVIPGPDGQPQPLPEKAPAGRKAARAQRVAEHMSWQFLHQMPEWEPDTDAMLHYIASVGCAFRKLRYDEEESRPRTEWVKAEDFITNVSTRTIEDGSRYAQRLRYYTHEIIEKMRVGRWREVSMEKFERGARDDDTPLEFYEVYCRLDLDQDGYAEPYIVVIESETGEVLRMALNAKSVRRTKQGSVASVEPDCRFVKYSFLPNPKREFYDIGFGWLLGPINETINTTVNQLLDAGHWANTMQGFYGKGLRVGAGAMSLSPNEFKPVESTGGALREQIYEIQHPGPSPVSFSLLSLMISAADDISSVKDIMVGDTQANLAPGTIASLIEQGQKQFQAVFKRIHRAFGREAKMLFNLNRDTLHGHAQSYTEVLDDPEAVAREDYALNFDIIPVTDPSMVSDQASIARAQMLLTLADQGKVNPQEALRRFLEAARIDGANDLLEMPPPPPNAELEFRNKELQIRMMQLAADLMEKDNAALEKWTRAVANLAKAEKDSGDAARLMAEAMRLDAAEEATPAQ